MTNDEQCDECGMILHDDDDGYLDICPKCEYLLCESCLSDHQSSKDDCYGEEG